ncbi:hypothetical protein F5Y03DRAFT_162496 [Xylaria venustula]|nr:hypothetical protein F5Y03DRAFT_162496 [Xylaria venustula]
MLFLTETVIRRAGVASRFASVQIPRQFGTSMAARKTISESAKDTLKSVDRKVSDKIVEGINISSKAAETVTGKATEASYKATDSAEGIRNKAKANSEELAGKAKGTAEEAKGTIKGAAKEAEGKAKANL